MTIRRELIVELLKEYESPQEILGEGGLLKDLTKAVIERCLQTELDSHLGSAKYGRQGHTTGNTRNGQSQQTLKGEQGHLDIADSARPAKHVRAAARQERANTFRGLC